jgi:hypothetical protein
MLHYETVEKPTLDLLKKLMNDNLLKDFNLVGGTALALRLGHRKSIDIDLFTNHPFDVRNLTEHLQEAYQQNFHSMNFCWYTSKNTIAILLLL